MTTFDDGPAAGITLCIRRAPIFLRVVRDCIGEWDALDQLDDRPRAAEAVFAYRKASDGGTVHINSRDRKTGRPTGGFFHICTYRVIDPQPAADVLRDEAAWREWCQATYDTEHAS